MAGGLQILCYNPAPAALTNATEFHASLLPLLAALPSVAAPTGFASLRSDRGAFVRGLCFGGATAPSACLGCLSVAARKLTSGCGTTTRRAGIWTDGSFLAYADTDASSPAEDAFRSRVLLRGHGAALDVLLRYDGAALAVLLRGDGAGRAVPDPDADNLHAWLVDMAKRVAHSAAVNISGARMLATAEDAATPAGRAVRSRVHVLVQCASWDRRAAECVR